MLGIEGLLKAYAKKFGDGFPTFQVARGKTESEVAEIINKCIELGKDAYELGYVENDPDGDY